LTSALHCDPRGIHFLARTQEINRPHAIQIRPLIIVSFLVVQSADPVIAGLALDVFLTIPMPAGVERKNDHVGEEVDRFHVAGLCRRHGR